MPTRNINGKCVNCPCAWWWCGDNKDCWLSFQERKGIKLIEPPKLKLKSISNNKKRKPLKSKLKKYGIIYKCHYCGIELEYSEVTVDHKIPISKGGSNRKINLLPSCYSCNQEKRSLDYEDFIKIKK